MYKQILIATQHRKCWPPSRDFIPKNTFIILSGFILANWWLFAIFSCGIALSLSAISISAENALNVTFLNEITKTPCHDSLLNQVNFALSEGSFAE